MNKIAFSSFLVDNESLFSQIYGEAKRHSPSVKLFPPSLLSQISIFPDCLAEHESIIIICSGTDITLDGIDFSKKFDMIFEIPFISFIDRISMFQKLWKETTQTSLHYPIALEEYITMCHTISHVSSLIFSILRSPHLSIKHEEDNDAEPAVAILSSLEGVELQRQHLTTNLLSDESVASSLQIKKFEEKTTKRSENEENYSFAANHSCCSLPTLNKPLKKLHRLLAPSISPTLRSELISLNISPAVGALIVGPRGSGKSTLAKEFAALLRIRCFKVSIAELIQSTLGDTEKGIRQIFATARQQSPCIVLLDDINTLAPTKAFEEIEEDDDSSEESSEDGNDEISSQSDESDSKEDEEDEEDEEEGQRDKKCKFGNRRSKSSKKQSFGKGRKREIIDEDSPFLRNIANQLCSELDNMKSTDDNFVIVATAPSFLSVPEILTRSGRLDTIIKIKLPDFEERSSLLHHHINKLMLRSAISERAFQDIVSQTEACSPADISSFIDSVSLLAASQRKMEVDDECVYEALKIFHERIS
ncbi:p97B [Monocercomonoides exilis]|uniref:p97B n=1 Tax=Monocercomonoides exilis TaxID=2049356 RepID=UPI00355A007C|nr:p97B [Monocercomonoides exilis]|eukprot:MONOS_3634.1-p1 / transcript=MONOS_3634.1 / gene=MONOS_3634 / organism=Monocercomonoides_exilis_PA203 / gene_product= p97B / transcript_product= p97B / location=Mono_scaffold00087:50340-52616(+) / protein_length=533 / sequence_SO=supercontig / SO=protein_coding / is_pseudo=false